MLSNFLYKTRSLKVSAGKRLRTKSNMTQRSTIYCTSMDRDFDSMVRFIASMGKEYCE